jgi:hypothetical protein
MVGAIIVPVQTMPPAPTTVTMLRVIASLGAERLPVIAYAGEAASKTGHNSRRKRGDIIPQDEPSPATFVN